MDFGLFFGLLCHWCQLLQAAPTELWTPGGWLLDVGYCGKPNALNHAQYCHQWTVKTIIKVALWQWLHHACGEFLVQYNQSHYRCTPGRPWSETDGIVRNLSLDLKFEKSPFSVWAETTHWNQQYCNWAAGSSRCCFYYSSYSLGWWPKITSRSGMCWNQHL